MKWCHPKRLLKDLVECLSWVYLCLDAPELQAPEADKDVHIVCSWGLVS